MTFDRGEQPKNLEWQRQKGVEGASSSVLTTVWTMVIGQVFESNQAVCEEEKGDGRETGEKRRESERNKSESRIVKMYTEGRQQEGGGRGLLPPVHSC